MNDFGAFGPEAVKQKALEYLRENPVQASFDGSGVN